MKRRALPPPVIPRNIRGDRAAGADRAADAAWAACALCPAQNQTRQSWPSRAACTEFLPTRPGISGRMPLCEGCMPGEAPQGRAVGAHYFIWCVLLGGKRTSWLKPPISRSSYEGGQALRAARQPDQCRGTYHPGPRREPRSGGCTQRAPESTCGQQGLRQNVIVGDKTHQRQPAIRAHDFLGLKRSLARCPPNSI